MKLVWLDLDSICKIYKRIKKTEKEKEENKIKMEKGRGNPFGPIPLATHGPPGAHRTGTSLSPSHLADTRAHVVSISSLLQPFLPPVTEPEE
jgi:hypothetical protein